MITSGPNAYWNTGAQVTRVAGGAADASVDAGVLDLAVDTSTTYQGWTGWGGTFNEQGWDALSVVSSQIPMALKLLFDPNEGLGLVYGRIPMGGSDYAIPCTTPNQQNCGFYTEDDTANDSTMANFSIARDKLLLIPYIKAALQVQPNLHLWTSPWDPPAWMRNSTTGDMNSDAVTLGAFALYQAKFVQAYAEQGLTIEAVHPQNEPGYAWAGWPGDLYIDFVKTYVGPTFAQQKIAAAIWCGTMSAPSDGTLATTLAADPTAMSYVKGFGLQWNTQDVAGALAMQRPVMQTEHECGNYPFDTPYWNQSQYNPNMPPNDHAYGEESWQLIRDWIVAGVNSYSAWNLVLDTLGMSLVGWPQDALLVVDRSAKTLTVTAAYYTFRHYSLILAGATRIGITGSKDALAFKNPDGSVITQVYNSGDSAQPTTVGLGNASYQFAVPAHGWATLRVAP